MTIVIARKFGERIVIASDTMITNRGERGPSIIPGRLKSIVLDIKLSVAYAGRSDQALKAICQARFARVAGEPFDVVIGSLLRESESGETDFIIASHEEGPQIRVIKNGSISIDRDSAAIGDTNIVRLVLDREPSVKTSRLLPITLEEQRFRSAFQSLFVEGGVSLTDEVGGLPVFLLASPFGHICEGCFITTAWDPVWGGIPASEEQLAGRKSGMTEWAFQMIDPTLRGIGALGVIVPNAGIAWIHSPLQANDAIRVNFTPVESDVALQKLVQSELAKIAEKLGGGVWVDSAAPGVSSISVDDLKEIAKYAEKSPNPTEISLANEGFYVSCRGENMHNRRLISYRGLENPLEYIKSAIDQANEDIAS